MSEQQRRKRISQRISPISEADYAMTTAEIAQVMACTHQNVSVSIIRSMRKIKKALQKRGIGPQEVRAILGRTDN